MTGKAIALVMAASSALLAGSRAQLAVAVYNYAEISDEKLIHARERAQLIFQHAGVQLFWLDQQQTEAAPNCPTVRVRLLRKTPPVTLHRPVEAMGRAYLEGQPNPLGGSMVDAYRDQIEACAGMYGADSGELLGAVIAHELGHALLGTGHTRDGLMSAAWSSKAMESFRKRWLYFDSIQRLGIARVLE